MQHKFETQNIVKSFVTFAHTQFHAIVKAIRVDNGSEFLSMRDFFPNYTHRISTHLCLHSLFELLYCHPPSFNHLRVFGCFYYATVVQPTYKFNHRAQCCTFVGYPIGQKCYKLYNLDTNKFLVSRDVKFCDNTFPFSQIPNPNAPSFMQPHFPPHGLDDVDLWA